MPGEPLLLSLYAVGALIGLAVAVVSLRGYRGTHSPTLLRLTTAFILISISFLTETIVNLASFAFIPFITITASVLVLTSGILETAGYFFLAFSHMVNVRSYSRNSILGALLLPTISPSAALQSISFYFILYGAVETMLAYRKVRNPITAFISIGLIVIALSVPLFWLSFLYPTVSNLTLFALVAKISGFAILFLPVLRYTSIKRVI